ncbi:CG32846 [Drosophila busckii]|uniref:CG32846 n=1 Tax=Drosophila busckii TaxID=30019 RepID=A0A0M4F0Z5_DROBS|nr:CG32846 [Drosophila busckii]
MRSSQTLWIVALFMVVSMPAAMCGHKRYRRLHKLSRAAGYNEVPVCEQHPNVNYPPTSQPFDQSCEAGITPCPAPQNPNYAQPYPQPNNNMIVGQCSQQQQPMMMMDDDEQRSSDLRKLVQHLYVAQARVQLEASEIHKAQAVAGSAQSQLEDSANHVRTITATLHNAQQEVAAAAIRAQIAQLQLAAHDQLLFAARQDVDALSSQVVGLQAAEGIVQPKLTVDLHALLDKLRQPLQHLDRPTPVPMIVNMPPLYDKMSPAGVERNQMTVAMPQQVAAAVNPSDAATNAWQQFNLHKQQSSNAQSQQARIAASLNNS